MSSFSEAVQKRSMEALPRKPTRIEVELTGASPLLMAHYQVDVRNPGRRPANDHESAERKLYRDERGLYLPWDAAVIAIGRASRATRPGSTMPVTVRRAQEDRDRLDVVGGRLRIEAGPWEVHNVECERAGFAARHSFPRFDDWTARFTVATTYEPGRIRELLQHAGRRLGFPQFAEITGDGWGRFEVAAWVDRQPANEEACV